MSTIRDFPFAICALLLGVFSLSATATAVSIRYARRRNLIDEPGRRRSHTQPTPRGGGLGIVVAAAAVLVAEMFLLPQEALPDLVACLMALLLVAAVGWIDDHGGLAARWRFLAHCVAAVVVLAPQWTLAVPAIVGASPPVSGLLFAAAAFVLVWSINLHNFMDGIDGLLALQALFVFVALGALAAASGASADALHLFALAAAAAGFVPFNFPRARVFMGDVGSGAVGLLIGIAALRELAIAGVDPYSGLIAVSAFVVDASCNLVSRMLRGRRWYSAHREHLYQWLARSGGSHARVVAVYAAWNLCVAAPVLVLINAPLLRPWLPWLPSLSGAAAAAGVYGGGCALWIIGKRRVLLSVKSHRNHAA